MTRYCLRALCLRLALLGLLWLQGGHAFASTAPRETAAFLSAARATVVGNDASQAYFLVDLFRGAGAPADEVEALRRELLHAYLAQLTAPAAPPPSPPKLWESLLRTLPGRASPTPDTVAAAIARGHRRASVLEASFRSDWQSAFNQGLTVRWGAAEGRLLSFLMASRDLQPIAPGAWAAPGANGRVWLKLALRLVNTSPRPLPIYRPDLLLGAAPDGTQPGLAFACQWDRLPTAQSQSEMQANAVTLLPPGAESETLVCEAQPVAAFWRDRLPALLAKPLLVPHDLDNARRLFHLELALAQGAQQAIGWSQRLLVARQQGGIQWTAGEHPLEPPERRRWATGPDQGWRGSIEALKAFLGATALGLGLFAAGRGLLRLGMPKVVVAVGTLAAGAGLFAVTLAQMGGGTGYGHPLYLGIGLWSAYFGPVLLAVLALHGLHKLLDDEQRDWWESVIAGWRHALDLTRETSRADFWGFLAHCAWLWALVRICLAPLDRWIGVLLLVPLLTLTVRRLRSMTHKELIEMGLTLAALVLIVLI